MKKVLSMAACILALVPVMGIAKDAWYNGIYLGASVGGTRIEADLIDLGLMPADAQENPETIENNLYKKTSITGKFFFGYRIFKYLGVEAGYQKLHDVEQAFCFTDDTGGCAEVRGLDDSGLSVISSGCMDGRNSAGVLVGLCGWLVPHQRHLRGIRQARRRGLGIRPGGLREDRRRLHPA